MPPISSNAPRPLGAAYVPILLSEVGQEQRPSGSGDREAGIFPKQWKQLYVTPLYKKGNRNCVSSYRPISNLSKLCLVLERLVFDKLYQFVKKATLWSSSSLLSSTPILEKKMSGTVTIVFSAL